MLVPATVQAVGTVAPPCLGKSQLAAAETFYKRYSEFYLQDPKQLRGLVTAGLLYGLAQEYQCKKQGELCAIEADPWSGAQDGEIKKPISFRLLSGDNRSATVAMHYLFVMDGKKEKQSATLQLERNNPNACWQVADIVSATGSSLRQLLQTTQSDADESPLPPPGSNQATSVTD
ncbi:DUF3828 domain-containing protein [Candidatus Magnetaquicoccus inordinatus]|uniref:DUF3828 domain-containing protein n=1 Tax=Candidatus Magnetaquicoccus inordinatus TaxID=2496818 RepID=UPI001D0E8550|nr:DUF3828 domain-containing protein [Candidatus Magnetaquicoccus inordinatus]